jgi:molybdopterin adenylyltransferase
VPENGRRAAVLTVSDGVFGGTRDDASGRALAEMLEGAGFEVAKRMVVPDERAQIEPALMDLAGMAELVVTTGGTGLGPRDVTPEATRAVIEREAPGLPEVIRADGRAKTPMAVLSRGVAGVVKGALVLNLPGSPKAVTQSLEGILPVLTHALDLIAGHTAHDSDSGGSHGHGEHEHGTGEDHANVSHEHDAPAEHAHEGHEHASPEEHGPGSRDATSSAPKGGARDRVGGWDITGALADRVRRGEDALLATAVRTFGAPPCQPGQKLLLGAGGPLAGTLGCSEFDDAVTEETAELLRGGSPAVRTYKHDLGSVEVLLEPYKKGPRLVVVAATPVALWLLRWGRDLGYSPVLVEPRKEWITPEHRQAASQIVDSPDVLPADPQTDVVHTDHDAPQVAEHVASLMESGVRFVGIIGSARHTGHHLEKMREMGLSDQELSRIQTPVGLNLGAKTPPEIALSILAGLMKFRTGREGDWLDPQHRQGASGDVTGTDGESKAGTSGAASAGDGE